MGYYQHDDKSSDSIRVGEFLDFFSRRKTTTEASPSDDDVRPTTKKAPRARIRRDDCRTGVLLISSRCVTKAFRANHAADP